MREYLPSSEAEGQRFKQLFELSRRLVISLNLEEILQATVEGVATIAGLDTAAIYLIESNQIRLYNTTPPLPPGFPEELRNASLEDHAYMRKAIESSSPVFIPDAAGVALTEQEKSVLELRNLRTLLFLPLIAEKEVMGALIVGSIGTPTALEDGQISLTQTLANFAALAVKNSRLYETGLKHAKDLERTLEERRKAEADREKLQEQLLQSQKMEAIGRLAGGVAHDYNNMLSGILGNAELILESTSDQSIQKFARDIITIGKRSAELTLQLLAFSRKKQLQSVPVDLHQIVEDVLSILKHTISPTIEIIKELSAPQHQTLGDPAQIQSVLLNLSVNARDAMSDGGRLHIETTNVDLDNNSCDPHTLGLEPARYIEMSISDTGVGMDEETIERIYEPFFTTKPPGEGTGLGLSAVYGTMMTLGGGICIQSQPGKGTTFKLYFPLHLL